MWNFKKNFKQHLKEEKVKEEWIWVEGYKILDTKDISEYDDYYQNYYKSIFHKELDPLLHSNNFIKSRARNFPRNIIEGYSLQHLHPSFGIAHSFADKKIFKVRALVEKSEWTNSMNLKTAKEIIFEEEIVFDKDAIAEIIIGATVVYSDNIFPEKDRKIDTIEEAYQFIDCPTKFTERKFGEFIQELEEEIFESKTSVIQLLRDDNFSAVFNSLIIFDSIAKNKKMCKFIEGIINEEISRDMLIYLILKEHEKIKGESI